jgi:phage protein U
MAEPILGVGPYRFKIVGLNYQSLDRKFEYRWKPQDRIGRRPAMQFLGPGMETVSLKGVLYPGDPRLGSGFKQLENMRKEAMFGVPRGVASSLGRYYGLWCITEITDVQSYFDPNGSPRKVEFTINLAAYGPDGGGLGLGLF